MKKRILFFIATLDGGGAERLLLDLVNHMDADKFDVTVFPTELRLYSHVREGSR